MNVAIIGASGIGKHHAKWFHLAGCQVVAFSGTSPESCRQTTSALQKLFGFQGKGYTDYRQMLASESIDIIGVCSPPETHLEHIQAAVEAGCHVYCEKPFAWINPETVSFPLPSRSSSNHKGILQPAFGNLLDQARKVVDLADRHHRILGFNTQYVAAQSAYQSMYEKSMGPLDTIENFGFLLESKGISGRHAIREGIWIDMASHALSQIIAWMPDSTIDEASIDCQIKEDRTIARFQYGSAQVEAILGKNAASELRRQFGVNGFTVDYEGKADEQGQFRSYLYHGDQSVIINDLVQISIQRFLDVVQQKAEKPFVNGHEILKNLEMTMLILEYGKWE